MTLLTKGSTRMIRVVAVLLTCVAGCLLLLPAAQARPNIRQGFFDAYPSAAGSVLDSVPSTMPRTAASATTTSAAAARRTRTAIGLAR